MSDTSPQERRERSVPGYYLINRATESAEAGPFSDHHAAQQTASHCNRTREAHQRLEVRLLGPSKVPDF